MKKIVLAGMAAIASLAATGASAATTVTFGATEGSKTDLFSGATVTGSTQILNGFTAADAFGSVTPANDYPPETTAGGHVIFANQGANFITFQTAAPVSFNTFRIFASGDGVGTAFRGFTSVTLSYFDGTSFQSLGTASYNPAAGPVTITGSFAGITAQQFRFDSTSENGGPRLIEIDAVPEPATWGMMILGFAMVGMGLRARRKTARVAYA